MPYSEKQRKYANEWYHKNKARLLADPKRKAAKRIADRKDYHKHKDRRLAYQQKYNRENRAKVKENKRLYHQRTRHLLVEKNKIKRQTEAYKQYVRDYREKNKEKIKRQCRWRGAAYIRRQIEGLTDTYIVSQILMSPLNKLTASEVRAAPELIEKKRSQIMSFRQKYGTKKMEVDILAEIESAEKERNKKPYEFVKEWRD